jgi:predicted MFS family arabinose efflux permease
VAAPLVGRIADRRGGRDLLMAGAFVAAAAMIIQGAAKSYWLLLLGQAMVGIGIGGTLSVISAYIGRMAPEGRVGTAFGLDAMAVSLSGAIGPSLGGWLGDTMSRRTPLFIGSVAMALAAFAVLLLPRQVENQPHGAPQTLKEKTQ